MSEHPEACNCITYRAEHEGRATCWYCIHGQHGKCTAHQHGNPADACIRADRTT